MAKFGALILDMNVALLDYLGQDGEKVVVMCVNINVSDSIQLLSKDQLFSDYVGLTCELLHVYYFLFIFRFIPCLNITVF